MAQKERIVYEIDAKVLNALVKNGLGLTWGKGSLFESVTDHEDQDFSDYKPFLTDEHFILCCKILTSPSHWMVQRNGGGQTALQAAHVYFSDSVGSQLVLVTSDTQSDRFLVQLHDDLQDYINWLVDRFCSSNNDLAINYMPPKLTISQFYMLLHVIDSYRRITYSNMLGYDYKTVLQISSKDFYRTLRESLDSGDSRWLVPSVETLLPSVKKFGYTIDPEDLKILFDLDFMDGVLKDDQGGMLVLSDIGILNGLEFLNHWSASIGIEIYGFVNNTMKLSHQVYIAPTRLSNHMVEFSYDSDQVFVNHQVQTKDLLLYHLGELIKEQLKKRDPDLDVTEVPEATGATETTETKEIKISMFCSHCGSKLQPDANFCNSCGTKVN